MLFSRFWILLLAAVAGLAVAAMSLARSTYQHDRGSDAAALCVSDRKLIEEFLRREARSRVDDLAPVSANSALVGLMETRSRATEDTPAVIGTQITQRLRELNQSLGALRGDVMIAVDPRGVVVGRTGIGEGEVGANLGALPLVASALAGHTRDDIWEVSGQAYRMAARPVIAQGRYYVGAIVHGMIVNDGFVTTVAQLAPGASVMVFGPEGMYASYHPVGERGMRRPPAPGALVERLRQVRGRDDWKTRGATDPIATNEADPDDGMAVFGSLPGMVGAAGGGIAVARAVPSMPADFLLKASKEDLARVPGGAIAGIAVLLALLGNLFIFIEFDSKRKKLHEAFKGLQQGGADRLDPLVLSGFAREVAVDANEAFDEVVKREVQRSAGRVRNVNELESLLNAPEPSAPQRPAPMGPPMPAPMGPPMPAPMAPSIGQPVFPPPGAPVPGASGSVSGKQLPPPPPNVRRAQPPVVAEDEQPTAVAARALPMPDAAPAGDPEELAHWRESFDQFVARKRECGEATETLTYEKFSATLQKHKDQLIAKTGCRTVRFQVYVKDGKATLKATPVR